MLRLSYEELFEQFKRVLISRNFDENSAVESANVFAQNSLDGIYSHGINRFARIISYIDNGGINPTSTYEVTDSFGAIERWNGHQAFGPLNAKRAMDRACELAKANGIGIVALGNNNHWLRGGSYGWQAANQGCIGMCWSNTMPNMPAWGGVDVKLGNNPLVISVPRTSGEHIVLDMAMSQFSYGKMEEYKLKGEQLPTYGGYGKDNELTTDPAEITETRRTLPAGFWKGSGLSLVLDIVGSVLSLGHATCDIGKFEDETGLTQILIAIDPAKFNRPSLTDEITSKIVDDLHGSIPINPNNAVRYPGEREYKTRVENTEIGIPVNEDKWNEILAL